MLSLSLPYCCFCWKRKHLRVCSIDSWESTMGPYPEQSTKKVIKIPTRRCRLLHEKLTNDQSVKKFPTFHETEKFITMCTKADRILFWASWIQYTPSDSIYLWYEYISNLFSHWCPDLWNGLFPSGFLVKMCHAFLI